MTPLALNLWNEFINLSGPSQAIGTVDAQQFGLKHNESAGTLAKALLELQREGAICSLKEDEIKHIASNKKLAGEFVIWKKSSTDWLFVRVLGMLQVQRSLAAQRVLLIPELAEKERGLSRVRAYNARVAIPYVLTLDDQKYVTQLLTKDRSIQPHPVKGKPTLRDQLIVRILKEQCRKTDVEHCRSKLQHLTNLISQLDGEIHSPEIQRREPIPEAVRREVWRRDGGCCTRCASKQKLEFDHIIPFSEGGANTVRNLQLLCESCNRTKSNRI